MGQFLSVGLVTSISVDNTNITEGNLSLEDLQTIMQQQAGFALDLYDYELLSTTHSWKLRPTVFTEGLLPFLEAFYPIILPHRTGDTDEVIAKLQANPPDKWLEIAKSKYYIPFQIDNYAQTVGLVFKEKDFRKIIRINFSAIMLHSAGKIIMESDDRLFNFYTHCMHQTFASHLLARTLRTYITG